VTRPPPPNFATPPIKAVGAARFIKKKRKPVRVVAHNKSPVLRRPGPDGMYVF